jgi:hypothetical protein
MKKIFYALLLLLVPSLSSALDEGSFTWGEFDQLNDSSIRWEIDNNKTKKKVRAFINRGPIVFETRKGEEYGYVVDSVVIHNHQTNRTFYIYCWDFERENKMDMRGAEPRYLSARYTDKGIVKVGVILKGKLDGYILFDAKKPSFQYVQNQQRHPVDRR